MTVDKPGEHIKVATSLAAATVDRLRDTLSGLLTGTDSAKSLQSVCDALNDLLECHIVVLSLVDDEGMRVVAYSGHSDGNTIMGKVESLDVWYRMLEESDHWGTLRFCRDPRVYMEKIVFRTYADEQLMLGDGRHWGALNMLIAPMWSPEGDLVGAMTMDVEPGTPLPDELSRTVLELFTAQAGVAIHQHRLAEQVQADHLKLRLSEERYRLAFDNAPIGMTEFGVSRDGAMIVTRINRAAAAMFGVSVFDARDKLIDEVLPVVEGDNLAALMTELLSTDHRRLKQEILFKRADDTQFWASVEAASLPDIGGRPGILCQLVDITESRESARELEERARRDPLTGLANRAVLFERLAAVVAASAEEEREGALLFCDLDNFKVINDDYGHLVGDDVLSELARRLDSVVRHDDTAGRFGGDEFVIVAYPMTTRAAKVLGERVSESLSAPILIGGHVLRVNVSIGIAMINGTVEPAEVMRRADAAMYAVRARGLRPSFVVDTA